MKRWLHLLTLIATAAAGLALGFGTGAEPDQAWLALALVAGFLASDARLWRPARR